MTSSIGIFKIGPSSSDAAAPMVAAKRSVQSVQKSGEFEADSRIRVDSSGSLAHTGQRPGPDGAILFGRWGQGPHIVRPISADVVPRKMLQTGVLECPLCQRSFNIYEDRPKYDGFCDRDSGDSI
jgi:hypothetical protein